MSLIDSRLEECMTKYKDSVPEETIGHYVRWKSYEIGFTGVGITALDKEPDCPKPELPDDLALAIDEFFDAEAKFRRETFRASVLEVTGEDIGEL